VSIYNPKHNVVFIHVPKTAGTSMESRKFLGGGGHKTAAMIREGIGQEAWESAFKFAFVRDPLQRIVSLYYHLMRQHNGMSFVEYVRKSARQGPRRDWKQHASLQSHFLCDEDGSLLVDFVGRYHKLVADWRHVCEAVGVDGHLPHKRRGRSTDYSDRHTEETRALTRQLYARDYELLGKYFPQER